MGYRNEAGFAVTKLKTALSSEVAADCLRHMSPESIETEIYVPDLFPVPLNHANFEDNFKENIEDIVDRLPLDRICKGGVVESGSIEIQNPQFEPMPNAITWTMVIEFLEYDERHWSDGKRRVLLPCFYNLASGWLFVKCREA